MTQVEFFIDAMVQGALLNNEFQTPGIFEQGQ